MTISLKEIVQLLDARLRIAEIPDDPNALNGLQVEACQDISQIACAVDASETAIEEACKGGANLLLVHHGLFWSGNRPITGSSARKLRKCFEAGLSVYSAHLPLDLHPAFGNNIEIIRVLGLAPGASFGRVRNLDLGISAWCDLAVPELEERIRKGIGSFRRLGAGPERIRQLGVSSGGAGSLVKAAADSGLDAFITGEVAHYVALEAEERGIHLFLAGHYKTEVFGVKALGAALKSELNLPWFFVGHDTGL